MYMCCPWSVVLCPVEGSEVQTSLATLHGAVMLLLVRGQDATVIQRVIRMLGYACDTKA